MTSEIDVSKTNEILRRRKLRLQQVREQSKDIAKKVRQRAKTEQLQHVVDLDGNKEKQYFQLQEKLVDRLEQLYSKSLQNVGTGHKDALELNSQDMKKKTDLSKLRGREAVAELRKKKQEILDEKKKQLDRKLQAREAANELSREKSVTTVHLLKSKSDDKVSSNQSHINIDSVQNSNNNDNKVLDTDSKKNDIATQWEAEELPKDWEPNVPSLSIPKDDKESQRISENDTEISNKSKRMNLFALSDEMPASLRGSYSNIPLDTHYKPTTTVISEYLQSRQLRLRESEPESIKKPSDDLQSIKQTILRTRASKVDGNSICHVLDEQVIPVPAWRASNSYNVPCRCQTKYCNNFKQPVTNTFMYQHEHYQINKTSYQKQLCAVKSFKDSKFCPPVSGNKTERSKNSIGDSIKKHCITLNNRHNLENNVTVVREENNNDDAYTRALKETLNSNDPEPKKVDHKKVEMRNKVAVAKDKIDKEYKDTLAFLNSLAKTRSDKPIREAFMDDDRQKIVTEKHQRKLHEEFTNLQREHCRKNCKHTRRTPSKSDNTGSPVNRHKKYDWLPVPEGDGNLVIHTLPLDNDAKCNNTVKFSDIDTYHEYRSRHKHTPPSKDDNTNKRTEETVFVEHISSDTDTDSISSESSSLKDTVQEIQKHKSKNDHRLSDGDKIIIYKIVQSKMEKRSKKCKKSRNASKISSNMSKSIEKTKNEGTVEQDNEGFENLSEGIYKAKETGDNVAAIHFAEDDKINVSSNDNCKRNRSTTPHNDHEKDCIRRDISNGDNRTREEAYSAKAPATQPSVTSSTNLYKTADIQKPSKTMQDFDFLKPFDGDHEAAKFYIGASGFLKDNNYEVVIQLKKKESDIIDKSNKKIDNESAQVQAKDKSKVDIEVQYSNDHNLKETAAQTSVNIENIYAENASSETNIKHNPLLTNNEDKIQSVNMENETDNVQEIGVHTSFKDSFTIPVECPKTDSIAKPATSTYTQTSFSSPNARPVLLHMTSSTSTAYMSPPDFIHPKFLGHIYDPLNQRECEDTPINIENQNCFKVCRCTRSRSSHYNHKKTCKRLSISTNTPPNTARSFQCDISEDLQTNSLECNNSKRIHKGLKKIHKKSHSSHVIQEKHKSLEPNQNTRSGLSHKACTKNVNINPVVKQYVNKLLGLNKGTLKAVQVINQECSAIETPGSSIINDSNNIGKYYKHAENKISLEQIKVMVEQQITKKLQKEVENTKTYSSNILGSEKQINVNSNLARKKHVHKVKSLNISKHFVKTKRSRESHKRDHDVVDRPQPRSSSSNEPCSSHNHFSKNVKENFLARHNFGSKSTFNLRKKCSLPSTTTVRRNNKSPRRRCSVQYSSCDTRHRDAYRLPPNRATATSFSTDSEKSNYREFKKTSKFHPADISTQTSAIDSDINFMKLAENKLHNMEKIADLTERCTKRLSNLAKVLEEVRKNKSLVYGQVSTSDSASESEIKKNTISAQITQSSSRILPENKIQADVREPSKEKIQFVQILTDIPKPSAVLASTSTSSINNDPNGPESKAKSDQSKSRGKPPPALSRVNLKNVHDITAVPHELSTVMEVDSPMSVNLKSNSSRKQLYKESTLSNQEEHPKTQEGTSHEFKEDHSNSGSISQKDKFQHSKASFGSSEESKAQMMDMKLFNEIMLKPFVSLQDYVNQCNGKIEEGSNLEDLIKDNVAHEELSSLHSDGSLPDVISELLKRKIISEPFKLDTGSNGNTNTTSLSSESSMSLLALSKIKKEKKFADKILLKRDNFGETSGTLSLSSNPDLEHAFKKLGMGWASSTLKKTKERLALSSSSNTSSSSLNQLKSKSGAKDGSSVTNEFIPYDHKLNFKNETDNAKNAVQQTSLTNSMTVKEFLTNELAKKITFTNNNSTRNDNEFVSLYETKMPDEIKNASKTREEHSGVLSPIVRARTSTPVQIYRSATYHSTSSSNTSESLFSNAEELSSVKVTSNSLRNHSISDKDDLTIPNYSLRRKGLSDNSKSD
ncbi:uncharacterized protein LOC126965837 isoform X2 [Leptidea sinapis]|uniref:uncharacterized protein LOC126965837 isoform X2 n=1 Tax=Leptidea sinapis TaxID=189913 RepID=UPI00214533FC|nr:uncharacterized protein LOC126965837 isoform X2 [Leptidea sinapis]